MFKTKMEMEMRIGMYLEVIGDVVFAAARSTEEELLILRRAARSLV